MCRNDVFEQLKEHYFHTGRVMDTNQFETVLKGTIGIASAEMIEGVLMFNQYLDLCRNERRRC